MIKIFYGLLCILFFTVSAFAQETTGGLQGTLIDSENKPVAFANIIMVDTETNFKYGTTSQENGFYIIPNLAPSSFYKIEVSFLGFQTITEENVTINLGSITEKNYTLSEGDLSLNEIVVVSSAEKRKNGNETVLGKKQLKATPTINRSIQDLTKNLPENNLNSFGGASNRFNNLNIDGIANNDIIGFQEPASGAAGSSANGTPGGLSRSQPIGLGAVKEVSVKLAPFDVSIGNFSGASINLVTKNGTNNFDGEVYAYGNNQVFQGSFANGVKQNVPTFFDTQFGVGIGGAIKKDKLFYYLNVEQALSETPLLNAPGSTTSNITLSDVDAIANRLIETYDYDPGTFTDASIKTASTKIFTRLDFNISDKHKLTLRNNYVNSFADNLEWNSSIFNFGNQGYRHNSVANSLGLEFKSNFASGISNNLTLGFNTVSEHRDFEGRVFPHIQIAANSTNRIFAGTYREASVYNTDFYTLQLADKMTYITQNHTFTFGGLLQFHDLDYGFLSAWNGRWEYRSVDDFLNDRPRRIRGVYNINNNDFDFVNQQPSATVSVIETALYAQDVYRVSDKLTISGGIRLDGQFLPSDLPVSEEVRNTPAFENFDNKISAKPQVNPRLGFNLTMDENRRFKLRGGTGLFTGRLPYLWFAYTEYISGTEYFNVDIRPDSEVPLTEDLLDLVDPQSNIAEINLIDNDFVLPREWKTNIAIEAKLPKKWGISLEATYTEVLKGIFFQSINRRNELGNFKGADNRPYFLATGDEIKINSNFTNVFLLTNTNKGFRYNFTAGVTKEIGNYAGYLGYTNGLSKEVSSTVRSSPAANFEWNQAIFGNDPDLSFSNFDLRHKFISSHSYSIDIGETNHVFVSLLYNGRSGSPFSYVYQGDPNRDGSSRNDLVYVPRDASEIILVDITDNTGQVTATAAEQWQRLDNYIDRDPYLNSRRGDYVERNGAKTPWNHELDMKLAYRKEFKNGRSLSFSFDMLNVFNFLNKNWGRLVFVPNVVNSSFSLLNFVDIENEQPRFQFNIDEEEEPFVIDLQNSRWRAQLGVKFSF